MNYFNYFTEVEEHFQQRRGTILMLSTLDWALVETWRDAGIPLEAVLRGIDAAFDKRDARAAGSRQRAVNGLAWCAQAVMEEAQAMQEAAVGVRPNASAADGAQDGFARARVERFLMECAVKYDAAGLGDTASRVRELAREGADASQPLERLETRLAAAEERVYAMLTADTSDAALAAVHESIQRELAPYRAKMQAAQIQQLQRQILNKKLLEARGLPRLSLFYMPHE